MIPKRFFTHAALAALTALTALIAAMLVVAPSEAKKGDNGKCGRRNLNCTYDASGAAHGHRGGGGGGGKHQGKHNG